MPYPAAATEVARKTFGANVRARRADRTQGVTAARAGITQSKLSKIERGAGGEITLSLVLRLSVALECEPLDLLGFIDQTAVIARTEMVA